MHRGFKEKQGRRDAVYRFSRFEIDTGVPSVTLDGEPVELRAKALALLLLLIEERRRVVSKDEIFQRIWPDAAVTDATLAGCVQEIRKALGDDAKAPQFIKTVPKLGYRFVAPLEEAVEPTLQPPDHPAIATTVMVPAAIATAAPPPPARTVRWRYFAAAAVGVMGLAAAILVPRGAAPTADTYREAAWWKFDEGAGQTAADSSGNGLTGTVAGATWTAGIRGGALRLDGTGHRVNGQDPAGLLARGETPRTLSAWVRTESTNGDPTAILHYGETPGPGVLDTPRLMLLPDGRPAFANQAFAGFGDDRTMAIGPRSIVDGQWHHLAATAAGNRAVLYVDGEQAAAAAIRLPQRANNGGGGSPWSIGAHVSQTYSGFRGLIDDVRVWRRELRPQEIASLHRCVAGMADFVTPAGRRYYFSPQFHPLADRPARIVLNDGGVVQHGGDDYGGVQLVASGQHCATAQLRGADMGQDVRIAVELLVPSSPEGHIVQAGPYFRSKAAAPGDGILGGNSAGYWVQLHSDGKVSVRCLNPSHTVAFANHPAPAFDATVFHRLEVAAHGDSLEASLDGKPLTFDQAGKQTPAVRIPAHWETANPAGKNHGAAGIAFGSEPLRPKAGGQQAKGFSIRPY